jgi:hypothetical protein
LAVTVFLGGGREGRNPVAVRNYVD